MEATTAELQQPAPPPDKALLQISAQLDFTAMRELQNLYPVLLVHSTLPLD